MIAMRPICEPDVIDLLNDNRFSGEIEGYVIMDGPNYLGHMLYKVEGGTTTVLDCGVENTMYIDGAVRACVAAGENAGATGFALNRDDAALAKWQDVFCREMQPPIPNEKIFAHC